MTSLSQQAIEELFKRVCQRYFALGKASSSEETKDDPKQLEKIARDFIRIEKWLPDHSEYKFNCLYFLGTIRFNQQKYNASYKWLTKAKEVAPEKAYYFMDMYAGCCSILLRRKNRYVDAENKILQCFFEGMQGAYEQYDLETLKRLKQKYEFYFEREWPFEEKTLSCIDIADNLIDLANKKNYFVNNSKIQKLVYYAQAWYLGIHKIPLFEEDFEAWTNGPVIPALYEEYKEFEWQPIVKKTPHEIPRVVMDFLDIVTQKYLIFDCYELEQMIRKEPPWDLARGDLLWDAPSNAIIKKEWIKEYYIQRFALLSNK